MKNWYLIEQQPWFKEFFKEPPIISYTRGRSYLLEKKETKETAIYA